MKDSKENFSSEQFLAKLKRRDHDAIAVLIETYTAQLYRASLGLGLVRDAAEELVQSVWTTFYDVVPEFQGKAHVRTFIFGILYNKASEVKRDHRRFDSPDPIEDVLDQRFDSAGHWIKPPVDPEQFAGGVQVLELIDKCLDALPVAQRMAFTLKEIEREPGKEICKILGVSITNLGVILFRAKNRLRECIEGKTLKSKI